MAIAVKEKEDNRTTISISSELRRKIKTAASFHDMTINDFLDQVVQDVYQKPDCIRIREEIERDIKAGKYDEIKEAMKNNATNRHFHKNGWT